MSNKESIHQIVKKHRSGGQLTSQEVAAVSNAYDSFRQTLDLETLEEVEYILRHHRYRDGQDTQRFSLNETSSDANNTLAFGFDRFYKWVKKNNIEDVELINKLICKLLLGYEIPGDSVNILLKYAEAIVKCNNNLSRLRELFPLDDPAIVIPGDTIPEFLRNREIILRGLSNFNNYLGIPPEQILQLMQENKSPIEKLPTNPNIKDILLHLIKVVRYNFGKRGNFRSDELIGILKRERFPVEHYLELFRLLDICIRFEQVVQETIGKKEIIFDNNPLQSFLVSLASIDVSEQTYDNVVDKELANNNDINLLIPIFAIIINKYIPEGCKGVSMDITERSTLKTFANWYEALVKPKKINYESTHENSAPEK